MVERIRYEWQSQGKILQMEVVDDFKSRQHEAVSLVVKREKEIK